MPGFVLHIGNRVFKKKQSKNFCPHEAFILVGGDETTWEKMCDTCHDEKPS